MAICTGQPLGSDGRAGWMARRLTDRLVGRPAVRFGYQVPAAGVRKRRRYSAGAVARVFTKARRMASGVP
ncbi:hypothetical protein SCMC78_06840 [Streptomyces sp. CMC78]|uniref:Uncharacterized protein n=1 Tax=Streptomyces sp. CMC78 TaxID=3231512 RepID=A0AB33K5G1_9ACTN